MPSPGVPGQPQRWYNQGGIKTWDQWLQMSGYDPSFFSDPANRQAWNRNNPNMQIPEDQYIQEGNGPPMARTYGGSISMPPPAGVPGRPTGGGAQVRGGAGGGNSMAWNGTRWVPPGQPRRSMMRPM